MRDHGACERRWGWAGLGAGAGQLGTWIGVPESGVKAPKLRRRARAKYRTWSHGAWSPILMYIHSYLPSVADAVHLASSI
jgi:hypothetical protein